MNPVKATEYNWIENNGFEDVSNSLTATYDTWSFQAHPTWIFEGNTTLEWGLNSGLRETWINFNSTELSNIGDSVGSASLGIWVNIVNTGDLPTWVYAVDEEWDSSSLTYNNKPVINSTPIGFKYMRNGIDIGKYIYIDVTNFINGVLAETRDFYGFRVYGVNSSNTIASYSIEQGHPPILVFQGVMGNIGQNDISSGTYPWFSYWDNFGDTSYIGITDTEANSGDYSAYLTYLNSPYKSNMAFYQRINYLAVDNFTSINFYAKTDSSSNVIIQCWFLYSDLSSEYDSNAVGTFDSDDGWTEFNFDGYSATGKLIIDIYFTLISGDYGDRTYFDDIYLNATVESSTSSRFSWYAIPNMNISISGFSANALTKTNYVFYGTFYNGSGSAVDSGTFTVKSSKITIEGTVSYGKFNFDINERGSEYNGNDELFTITLNIDEDGIYVFKIYINWFDDWSFWDFTPPPTNAPPSNPYGEPMIIVIIHMIILIMPSAVFSGACFESKSIDPIFGIIAGLTLSAVLYYIVFNNILLIVVCVVVIGFLLFSRSRSGNNNE